MLKRFIHKTILIIIIPTLCFLVAYEVLYRKIPNDFKVKKYHLLKQQEQIETLIFGTSHAYNGVDPRFLSTKAYNLANDGQTLLIDKYLFNHYIDSFPNIKNIIFSVSYHTFTLDTTITKNDIWKTRKNQLYMGLKIKPYYKFRYWLECLYPEYSSTLIEYYINNEFYNASDSHGFYFKRPISPRNFQNLAQLKGHNFNGEIKTHLSTAKGNQNILESIIENCNKRNIKVFLLTTPCHHFYQENIDTIQYNIMKKTIYNIQQNYPNITYLDFFKDPDFIDEDYDNNNHLSIKGAEKLSKKLSSYNL